LFFVIKIKETDQKVTRTVIRNRKCLKIVRAHTYTTSAYAFMHMSGCAQNI